MGQQTGDSRLGSEWKKSKQSQRIQRVLFRVVVLKVGPQSSASPRNLLEMHVLGPDPNLPNQKLGNSEDGAQECVL